MDGPADRPVGDIELLGRAFLRALDDRRWLDAAALVDPKTREAFQAWCLEAVGARDRLSPPQTARETRFFSAADLLRLSSAADAARFTSTEFLARFAEAVEPGTLYRGAGVEASAQQIRIARTFVEAVQDAPDRATVRYRADWWHGDQRNQATGGIHSFDLILTADGWRVRDADLGGWGTGHIFPSERDPARS